MINRTEIVGLDLEFSKNFSFVDNVTIILDIGEFGKDPMKKNKKPVMAVIDLLTVQLDDWFKKECPHFIKKTYKLLKNK